MGEANRRGDFEQRKAQAEVKLADAAGKRRANVYKSNLTRQQRKRIKGYMLSVAAFAGLGCRKLT